MESRWLAGFHRQPALAARVLALDGGELMYGRIFFS
jgi:hypothetical protein